MDRSESITEESWRAVLASALALLAGLEQKGFGAPDFAMGGGTVLMLRFRHRLSRDVDLFLNDVQWLSLLTPRLNEAAAAMAKDYLEQANSIKLVTGAGDIDFIAAAPVFREGPAERLEVMGREVPLESTAEILAKKLLYRSESLKPRDAFDLTVAAKLAPSAVAQALAATKSKHEILGRRLAQLARLSPARFAEDIVTIGPFAATAERAAEDALRILREAEAPQSQTPARE